jgi:hypothetical protein
MITGLRAVFVGGALVLSFMLEANADSYATDSFATVQHCTFVQCVARKVAGALGLNGFDDAAI